MASSPTSPARRLRILFVCALNRRRSATAEQLYRNDARLEVRSAGVRAESARRVSACDLAWAEVVYVMESDHKKWLQDRFQDLPLPPIDVLGIPDDFEYMDPELQELLRQTLDPDLEHRLRAHS